MEELQQRGGMSHDERIARVVWAAHILSYLTNKGSNPEIQQSGASEDEETFENDELDAKTEKTTILTASRESIRRKFLDCVAQLLSRAKGWDNVTSAALREREDFVEVDIARNDCFGMGRASHCPDRGSGIAESEADFCRKLESYLGTAIEGVFDCSAGPANAFELESIDHARDRVDLWVAEVRSVMKTLPTRLHQDKQRWPGLELAVETLTHVNKLISCQEIYTTNFREWVVQQAYQCAVSTQVQQLLCSCLAPRDASKLTSRLRFLARPITDCRLLWLIASQEPQFRDVRISLIPPKPKTAIQTDYLVTISEAWARITSVSVPASNREMASLLGKSFIQDCAKPYTLHAEMQLITHYEDGGAPYPTLEYFGCSKKTCLLCEEFLTAVPGPITTRGRHGICYPAWGVPCSTSPAAQAATRKLEAMLVSRIKMGLYEQGRVGKTSFVPQIQQSGLVSDFSGLTLEEWSQKQEKLRSAKEAERLRTRERFIIEGGASTSRLNDKSLPQFEPETSCLMCNKIPARRCRRCRSCYYCSKECQKSDWATHKLLCEDFATQIPRPSATHKRAILFPVDRDRPRMIWVSCEREYDSKYEFGDGQPYEVANVRHLLGADSPSIGHLRVECNPVRNRNLGSGFVSWAPRNEGYCVSVKFRDAYLIDGSAINKSIQTSVGTSGTVKHRYCGPIVAVRELPFEFYADITLADFRHLIDYLVSYRSTELRESSSDPQVRAPTAIRGVKICCYGETVLHASSPFISVDVPRATQVTYENSGFGDGGVSSISKLLGMPLKLWKCQDLEAQMDPPGWTKGKSADSNQNAAFLMMETDPAKPDWGFAPMYWNSEIGNVLALRQDGQDLSIDDLQMMCHFARKKLQPMFEDALGAGFVSRTKQEVLEVITWKNMVEYWKQPNTHGGS